jgi:hypothetical protein
VVVEVPAVATCAARSKRLAVGRDDDTDHRLRGKRDPVVHADLAVAHLEHPRDRRLHLLDQLPEPGIRSPPPLDRPHVEDLRHERVARLSALDSHRTGRAVDPLESISVTRSSSLRIWPVKQSFVSKVTVSPGWTSSTGSRSGPNDQITWSRERRCAAATAITPQG